MSTNYLKTRIERALEMSLVSQDKAAPVLHLGFGYVYKISHSRGIVGSDLSEGECTNLFARIKPQIYKTTF
jgi:hypothetical protein